jgi:hypothetical protein
VSGLSRQWAIEIPRDQLGSEPAVAVLREMLWAEVNNIGVPIRTRTFHSR